MFIASGIHLRRLCLFIAYSSHFSLSGHWRIINYLDEGSIFNKGQGKKLSVRFKRFINLSQTMKFVPDFCHRLSIGPVRDKIHCPRQALAQSVTKFMVQDKFVSDFQCSFYLSRTFRCLSSLSCLYRQQLRVHEPFLSRKRNMLKNPSYGYTFSGQHRN